ncbi:recombinase family protein [Vibrio natriegens]|uniref:recombinase family protein n=1 Tax=Vibrio natriegens TaxID=691 RepID=UPI001EFC9F91|nr:recombinase family protein [Vibrio natriegens]MCG9702400.1 recombinase family protein [Vibrio natriegens]
MTTAYAYTRVSTTQQDKDGKHGLSRQLDTIREFLTQHPQYTLSDKAYTDKASGFHGMNIKDDAGLGSFLKDCENGIVKAGDMLCVELVDRLSRLPPDDARELFRRILSYGVKVAIVRWGIVIDRTENKLDLAGDLLLTVGFHLAHMESEQKSKRVFAAKQKNVQKAREGKKILFRGKSVPRWLSLNEDHTEFLINPFEEALVKRIFEMKLSGLGADRILRKLTEEGNSMFGGKALRTDSITRLLKNRRLLGEFQPQHRVIEEGRTKKVDNGEPIKGYFPQVIDEELFNAVQASFDHSLKGKAARSFNNVFTGLLKCSSCGHAYTQKNTYSKGKIWRIYYSCTGNTHRKACNRKSVHMNPVREKLLKALEILDYSQLQDKEMTRNAALQRGALETQIKELEKAIKNLGFAIAGAESEEDITDLMSLRNDKRNELSELNAELSFLNNSMTQGVYEELHTASNIDLEVEEERIRLNNLLHQYIDKIVMFNNGLCNISFKTGYKQVKRISVNTNLDTGDMGFIQYISEEQEQHIKDVLPKEQGEAARYLTNTVRMVLAGHDNAEDALKEAEQLSPLVYEAVRHVLTLAEK